jgi:formylglycine-generating enzyme required for sulfatase activity
MPAGTQPSQANPEFTNSLGMRFLSIRPGQFSMGSPDSEKERDDNVEQEHPVTLTRPFLMGVHEVTRGQFAAFVKDAGYATDAEKGVGISIGSGGPQVNWRRPGIEQGDDHPVVQVSWNDAVAFCLWLSRKEGRTYRLPTEAEWEYACRAGTTTQYNVGETIFVEQANYDGNYKYRKGKTGIYRAKTLPVGSFAPNAWGLYDMHGNVWEWCSDWLAPFAEKKAAVDPAGPATGLARVLKGGGWYDDPRHSRSAERGGLAPANRGFDIGFRLVLEPPK